MPIVTIVKRFLLKGDDDTLTEFLPGRYDVTQEVADHWYVRAHMEGFEPPPPKEGTEQYAVSALKVAQAARLGEAPEEQAQRPADPPPNTDRAEVRFAGRTLPKDSLTPGFIDPRL